MKNYRQKSDEAGFTLIELAISTIIVGILFAAIAFPYSIWLEKKKFEETSANVEQMAWVISAYRSANGYYPCPAPMDAPRDSAGYGYQTACDNTSVAVGTCSAAGNKYCVAQGERTGFLVDLDYDSTTPKVAVNDPTVRIGAIPFRDLNMPEEFAYDAYGNRILYAVTEGMAFDNVENHSKAGAIEILYKDDYASNTTQSRLDIPASANFVVLSHGPDKRGGFNLNGNLSAQPCDETTSDGENCDHIDGANLDAEFYVSEAVDADGDDRHDDVALFQLPLNAPLWARSSTEATNIYSIRSESNPTGQVGSDYLFNYYTDPTNATYSAEAYEKTRLWVGGNIKVESDAGVGGEAQALEICDRKGENCFKPEIIGGAGIECTGANESGMAGVIEGDVDCRDLTVPYGCEGQMLRGINNGIPDCVNLPCPAETKTSCSRSFGLPKSPDGARFSFSAGDRWKCSKGTFTCDNGVWSGGFSGDCTCTPSIVRVNRACPAGCTGGPKIYEEYTDCTRCHSGDTLIHNPCSCPPPTCSSCIPTATGGLPCGAGYEPGGLTEKRVTTCNTYPTCSSVVTTPSTCVLVGGGGGTPGGGGGVGEPPCTGGVSSGC